MIGKNFREIVAIPLTTNLNHSLSLNKNIPWETHKGVLFCRRIAIFFWQRILLNFEQKRYRIKFSPFLFQIFLDVRNILMNFIRLTTAAWKIKAPVQVSQIWPVFMFFKIRSYCALKRVKKCASVWSHENLPITLDWTSENTHRVLSTLHSCKMNCL